MTAKFNVQRWPYVGVLLFLYDIMCSFNVGYYVLVNIYTALVIYTTLHRHFVYAHKNTTKVSMLYMVVYIIYRRRK